METLLCEYVWGEGKGRDKGSVERTKAEGGMVPESPEYNVLFYTKVFIPHSQPWRKTDL